MIIRHLVIAVAIVVLVAAAAAGPACAEDGGDARSGGQGSGTMGKIVNYTILSLLGVLSIVLIGMVIWYFLSLGVNVIVPPEVLGRMEEMLNRDACDEMMDFCCTTPTTLTNIVAAGLKRVEHGDEFERISSSLKEAGEEETIKLEQRVSWLNLIGTIAPMLGLLGTVVGMLIAFDTIAALKNPQPSDLAAGIRSALWTTVGGLIVAIPAMSFFFYFRNRVDLINIELNARCEELFARFRKREK